MEFQAVQDQAEALGQLRAALDGKEVLVTSDSYFFALALIDTLVSQGLLSSENAVAQAQDPLGMDAQELYDMFPLSMTVGGLGAEVSPGIQEELRAVGLLDETGPTDTGAFALEFEGILTYLSALVLYRLLQAGVNPKEASLYSLILDYATSEMFLTSMPNGVGTKEELESKKSFRNPPVYSDMESYWNNWATMPESPTYTYIQGLQKLTQQILGHQGGEGALDLDEAQAITRNAYASRVIETVLSGSGVYESPRYGRISLSTMGVSTMCLSPPDLLIPLIVDGSSILSAVPVVMDSGN